MSLTPEAIDRIQQLSVASSKGDMPSETAIAVVMDGPGKTKIVSLEEFQLARNRFRGCMTTSSIKDFVDYATARAGDQRGFISADRIDAMSCRIFFNLGDPSSPGHGDDTAVLTPKEIAAFKAMREINGKHQTQQQLIDWMEDWASLLSVNDVDDTYMDIAQAVKSIRHLKLLKRGESASKVDNMAASKSAMEEIEAKAEGRMPGVLCLRTSPFDGFQTRSFYLRIAVLTNGDGTNPKLSLRWQQQEHQCEEIAQEFKSLLKLELGGLADGMVVGEFKLGA